MNHSICGIARNACSLLGLDIVSELPTVKMMRPPPPMVQTKEG